MKFDQEFKNGGGSSYLKLEDGESSKGVFAGEAYTFEQHNKFPKPSTLCTKVGCEDCLAGDDPATKFRINFITKEGGGLKAKIFEGNWFVWSDLKKLNENYDLERYTVEISRKGVKSATRYTIMPMPEGKINDEAFEKLKQIELCNLLHKGVEPVKKEAAPPEDDLPPFDEDEDLPF